MLVISLPVLLFPKRFLFVLPFLGAASGRTVQLFDLNIWLDQTLAVLLSVSLIMMLISRRIRVKSTIGKETKSTLSRKVNAGHCAGRLS